VKYLSPFSSINLLIKSIVGSPLLLSHLMIFICISFLGEDPHVGLLEGDLTGFDMESMSNRSLLL